MDHGCRSTSTSLVKGGYEGDKGEMWWMDRNRGGESLKNTPKVGKIEVKGSQEKSPNFVEVDNDGLIFSLPIWCECLPLVHEGRKNDEEDNCQAYGYGLCKVPSKA